MGEFDDNDIKKSFFTKKKCLVFTFVGTAVLLAIAIVVLLKVEGVRGQFPPYQKWWKKTIVYQIYPRSFQDSDGDGIGDLQGIISRLDYFKTIGVSAVWISPIYESPMKDFGYDIANFTNVDPMFGTLDTMTELIKIAHEKDIRVILDFVPNHSSNKHPWFEKSEQRIEPYTDYYIWANSSTSGGPPNNWISIFGNSSWEWSEVRQQYYYHAFIKEQPDLNYRNPAVRQEMKNTVEFWAKLGIDGLRVDAISTLFETTNLTQDEPRSNANNTTPNQWEYYDHPYTYNYPGVDEVVEEWRQVLDIYDDSTNEKDNSKLMVVEIYAVPKIRNVFYTNGANMPFNMDLVDGTVKSCDGICLKKLIQKEYNTLPEGKWPNFVMGNHDRRRLSGKRNVTKSGKTYTNVLNMLLLTLRGTPTSYYGDEIAMEDLDTISYNDTQDPFGINMGRLRYNEFSRDPERTPMQWNDQPGAGFTNSSKPWLPINDNYIKINVETQINSTSLTPIKVYKTVSRLRQEPAFLYGRFEFSYVDKNILSFKRMASGHPSYLVVLNIGDEATSLDYTAEPYNLNKGTVVASTEDLNDYKLDATVELKDIELDPAVGILFKLKV